MAEHLELRGDGGLRLAADVYGPAEALLQMLPHARFVDVDDASHMVAGDRNDAFSAAVLKFALPLLETSPG